MAKKKAQEDQIPDLKGQGWDWFEAAKGEAQTATVGRTGLTAEELQATIARCLVSPDGQILLAHLQDWIDMVKDFDPELGFYNGAAFGFWRSGQKSIVQYLRAIKERALK